MEYIVNHADTTG